MACDIVMTDVYLMEDQRQLNCMVQSCPVVAGLHGNWPGRETPVTFGSRSLWSGDHTWS